MAGHGGGSSAASRRVRYLDTAGELIPERAQTVTVSLLDRGTEGLPGVQGKNQSFECRGIATNQKSDEQRTLPVK